MATYFDPKELRQRLKIIFSGASHFSGAVTDDFEIKILEAADCLLDHTFDILGSGNLRHEDIDWHVDFTSGYRWNPGTFYKDYLLVDMENDADVKVPWELSRGHHFLILGQAYLLTGEERYAQECISQILDWIDSNPFMHSINWCCTMDVSIRSVNWIWALCMLEHSVLLTDAKLKKIVSALYEHGYFIIRNPECYAVNNHNHYISDLVGQIYLGIFFEGAPESMLWLRRGMSELYREMRSQILPTGPSYERSVNYHRLVLELCASAIILLKRNAREVPADIWYRLEKMFEFVAAYLKPDGTAPVIGDQDDGRLHPFGCARNIDHRYLLCIGAVLFNRRDFKAMSNGYCSDCYFLFGADSVHAFDSMPGKQIEPRSISFADAGFFIMRTRKNYMFINNSGKGRYSELSGGTHTHSDLLSFELFMNDKTFLVDTGSYIYSADKKMRKLFRTTKMHNTVVVDGYNQSSIDENVLWDFERNAIPRKNIWYSDDRKDFFSGEHSGYERMRSPVTHKRLIFFNKKKFLWVITDCLLGEGKHLFEWFFHFGVGIDVQLGRDGLVTQCLEGSNIAMNFRSHTPVTYHLEKGWVSSAYGSKKQGNILRISMDKGECPVWLKTTICEVKPIDEV